MAWLNLATIAAMVQGRLLGNDAEVESVSTDTRSLLQHSLFIALYGPRFDGHECVERDPNLPVNGVLVSRVLDIPFPQILVDDTQLALSRFADAWREKLEVPVIGLTGSNGKTTVKEMIAAILAQEGHVFATQGNRNNHIGVPLTLLSMRPHHDFAVVEMGANRPGEIGALTDIVRPQVALITNAGPAHLEGFLSLDGVAKAKAEIFTGLTDGGIAIINADDDYAEYWREQARGFRILSFGLDHPADVRAQWHGKGELSLLTPEGRVSLRLPLAGRHNVSNALAATAVALALGVSLNRISDGLASIQPMAGRLVVKPGIKRVRILDDSYNANPASFGAALAVLAECSGERWLVLGDMAELGESAETLHRQAGEKARDRGVARLYAVGSLSRATVAAFGSGAVHFESTQVLIARLKKDLHTGINVLVKGSRAMQLEQVVQALLAPGERKSDGKGAVDVA